MSSAKRAPIMQQHLHCLQMDRNEILHDPRHLGVPSGVSKTLCSVQTVNLSYVKISTISKRTESSFHMSLITLEYHRVCPKRFLSQWYVWRKPCTYLASRLPLSPNRLRRASTWPSSTRSTIGCVQNDFWAYEMFGANHAPILHRHLHCLQTDRDEIPHDPRHLRVPSGASKMISEPVVRSVQTVHLSCVKISTISKRTNRACTWASSLRNTTSPNRFPCSYLASRLPVSQNRLNQACSCASSPRSTIGCIQNDFWANDMFGANCAPILCQDYHYLQIDGIELPHEPRHLGVPPGLSKTISEAMVCLSQTVHLSCTKTNTISKWTKMRFHMTHIT
jgi:hypothetical protein